MKVIDLLNKIANGKDIPKCIKYMGERYMYENDVMDYFLNEDSYKNNYSNDYYLFDNELNPGLCEDLNEEVEIIEDTPKEDKKIEKLEITKYPELGEDVVGYPVPERIIAKINEIIDKLNGDK